MSNDMIENIVYEETVIAVIVYANHVKDGLTFVSDPDDFIQLGLMCYSSGHNIVPHIHRPIKRVVEFTQEVLFIRKGLVRVDFYTGGKEFLCAREIQSGDTLLLLSGGHGFEILEDSEIIEAKNGPYPGEKDKLKFAKPSTGQCITDQENI